MSIEQIQIIESPQVVAVRSTGQRIVVGEPRIHIVTASKVGEPGPMGIQGIQGIPGIDGAGGLLAVVDDPAPTLGGDLDLNGYDIAGILSSQILILDGGLL